MVQFGKKTVLVLIALILSGPALSQARPAGNEAVIAGLLVPSMLQVISRTVPPQQSLTVTSMTPDAFSQWLSQILLDSCLQRNYFVYSAADSAAKGAFVVKVGEGHANILYKSAGKKFLFFNKGIRRQVNAQSRLVLLNAQGRVLISETIGGEYSDVIPGSHKEKVENPQYPFTKGTKKASPFINRWLEPVLITVATSTVIYLFYSLRSEN